MEKITVALLAGGSSSEREVSLRGGEQVYAALDKNKYNILQYDPQFDLARLVQDAAEIDMALIILHGRLGEDGTIQGLLELLNIPYQGSGVLGSAVAMNKIVTKLLYEKAGLPVPPYVVYHNDKCFDVEQCAAQIGLPLVIKPAEAGSSVGVSIVKSTADLPTALGKATEFGDAVLVESYIDGMELTAGVIGNRELDALPLIEIIPNESHGFFDYEAKYTVGVTQKICPAFLSDELTQKANDYAKNAHRALYCRGYSRTDMILKDNELYLLETNTIPGMGPNNLYIQAANEAGMNFSQTLDKLIKLTLEDR